MTSKNTICLWFNNDAEEAARFYPATCPDSKVAAVRKAPSDKCGERPRDDSTTGHPAA
jgi:predicted 3-demethylubiquinone-9 3-methyltransferase (glyoxalase superfamily)